MHYHNGVYYLSYSHGSWSNSSYSVHYSTSSSAIGPWTYRGTILTTDDLYVGPGHHSILYNGANDEWLIIYHRWDPVDMSKRSVAIDRLYYDQNGLIEPVIMTQTGVGPLPLGKFLASDFDEDGTVNLPDLEHFCNAWLTGEIDADISPINGDGIVDIIDYAFFSQQWQRQTELTYLQNSE